MIGCGEGCPREYVTAESLQSACGFVAEHVNEWLKDVRDLDTLTDWVARHREEIDRNPAAWTAVELALLDLLGKTEGVSVEALLGLPELGGSFRYTAVVGDSSPRQFEMQLAHYVKAGFSDFKIKLSGDRTRDLAKVNALAALGISTASGTRRRQQPLGRCSRSDRRSKGARLSILRGRGATARR